MTSTIKIGVSTCLLGEKVRFDGGHKHTRYITQTLGKFFDFIPVCPEYECGLGIPRESMRLVGDLGELNHNNLLLPTRLRRAAEHSVLHTKENGMKSVLMLIWAGFIMVIFSSCSPRAIQETFWAAGTSVAFDEERKGNIEKAETELRVALARAERELDDEKIASSLSNLGSLYRRQEQLPKALVFLKEALILKFRRSDSRLPNDSSFNNIDKLEQSIRFNLVTKYIT